MEPLDLEPWHDFAVATAGAAGALAGLIMVAISVNVKEIIAGPGLAARAGATIASVMVILVSASALLIPHQAALWLGLELAAFGCVAVCFQVDAARRMFSVSTGAPLVSKIVNATLGVGALLWVVFGGIVVATGSPVGLVHVAGGFITIFITAVLNAWVLMIEILR